MQICPKCGATNRDNARFCSKCRTEFISRSTVIPSGPLVAGALLQGRYQITHVLGEGGFGAAYLATDTRLKRACVAKQMLIPPGTNQASLDELKRIFGREADALASLNQPGPPNIPEIYDFFSDPSGNFLVMKYIEGESLEQRLARQGGRLSWQEAVQFAIQVVDALAHMHGHQPPVLHRDIKPANILVDGTGRVWLVDFGLSKAQPAIGGQVGKTTGAGSLGYTALEQWAQKAVPTSDVYALGVTLHHMVTGISPEVPFQGLADDTQVAQRIKQQHGRFVTARQVLSSLPIDLETAIAAAVQADPVQRPTAAQWKAQLDPLVRPATTPAFRWDDGTVSKYPADLAAAADAHWDLARGYFTSGKWDKWFGDLHRNDLIAQVAQAKAQHPNSDVALDRFLRAVSPAYPWPALQLGATVLDFGPVPWQAQRSLDLEVINGGGGCMSGRLSGLPAWLQASPMEFATHTRQTLKLTASTGGLTPRSQPYTAQLAVDAGTGGQAMVTVSLAVPEPELALNKTVVDLGSAYQGEALRGSLMIHNHGGSAFEADVTKDATWVAVSPSRVRVEAGKSKEFQVTAGTAQMRLGRHSAKLVVKATNGSWSQVGAARVTANLPWLKTFWRRWAATLDWTAVGMLFALAWFSVIRPELMTRTAFSAELQTALLYYPTPVLLALLLIASGWLGILVYRVARPDHLPDLGCWGVLLIPVLPWLFNPLGALTGTAVAVTGAVLALKADVWLGLAASLALCGVVGAVAGGLLHRPAKAQRRPWSGLFGTALLIAAVVGIMYLASEPPFWWRQVGLLRSPTDIPGVTYAPDGATLASVSGNTVRLWRASDGTLLRTLQGHAWNVTSVAFAPDGASLASASGDKTVRLWRISDGVLLHTLQGHTDAVYSVTVAPDGATLASASGDKTVRLWRVSDGVLLRTLQGHTNLVIRAIFAPDGTTLFSEARDGTVRRWRVSDGVLLQTLQWGALDSVALAPDGTMLASAALNEEVGLWRASDGPPLPPLQGNSRNMTSVAFSPDGARLALGSVEGVVRLWRLSDGALLRTLVGHTDLVESVTFAPDRAVLASAARDGTVRLWWVGD